LCWALITYSPWYIGRKRMALIFILAWVFLCLKILRVKPSHGTWIIARQKLKHLSLES